MSLDLTLPPDVVQYLFAKLKTADDVADLLEIDAKRLTYHLYVIDPRKKYSSFTIPKASGDGRHIFSPNSELKILQQKLNQVLQIVYEPSKTTHGFIIGRSISTNAQLHVKKRYVFNIDLQNFFPTINFGRVRGLFMSSPYNIPAPAATVLAQICCYKNILPQGAPTSPVVSNMICAKLDRQLLDLAWKERCIYTRYADDITFSSSSLFFPKRIAKWVGEEDAWRVSYSLKQIVDRNGFLINLDKVRMQTYMESQRVTGLVTNERVNVPRKFVRQIRAMLYAWEKFGLKDAELEYLRRYYLGKKYQGRYKEVPRFREVVKGKIEFLGMVRGKDDEIYLRFLEKYKSLSALSDPVDRREMQKLFGLSPEETMSENQFTGEVDNSSEIEFDKKDWLNKSPVPLAAMLYAYDRLPDDDKDFGHLLKFFESLAEFIGIIQVSGFWNDSSTWHEIREKLEKKDGSDFFEAPGFGDWCALIRIGGKKIRTMLNAGRTEKESLFSMFKTEDSEFFQLLSDKKLAEKLEVARDIRNSVAHGGAIPPQDWEKNSELRILLSEIENIFGDFWEKFQLLYPGTSWKKKELLLQLCEPLIGFYRNKLKSIEVREILNKDELYLYSKESKDALKILPLLEIKSVGQSANVSYFYNRFREGKARFVSYYHELKSEIFVEDKEVLSIVSRKQSVT